MSGAILESVTLTRKPGVSKVALLPLTERSSRAGISPRPGKEAGPGWLHPSNLHGASPGRAQPCSKHRGCRWAPRDWNAGGRVR